MLLVAFIHPSHSDADAESDDEAHSDMGTESGDEGEPLKQCTLSRLFLYFLIFSAFWLIVLWRVPPIPHISSP